MIPSPEITELFKPDPHIAELFTPGPDTPQSQQMLDIAHTAAPLIIIGTAGLAFGLWLLVIIRKFKTDKHVSTPTLLVPVGLVVVGQALMWLRGSSENIDQIDLVIISVALFGLSLVVLVSAVLFLTAKFAALAVIAAGFYVLLDRGLTAYLRWRAHARAPHTHTERDRPDEQSTD